MYVLTYHMPQPLLFLQARPTGKKNKQARETRHACELEVAWSAVVQLQDRLILP